MCGGQSGDDFGCQKCAQYVLGKYHGWIECESTSFPGKLYYFHAESRCSTWQRPVPRNTQLPRYKKWRDLDASGFQPEENLLPCDFDVSGTECSVISSAPPSEFELHARRMQIYLQKNTDLPLAMKKTSGYEVRDKLLEYYKSAKSELKKSLNPKKLPRKKPVKVQNPKPASTKPQKIKKQTKIIRECNGIKTISYDHVPTEVPVADRMPDLSETSIDSFNAIPLGLVANKNHEIEIFNVKDIDLSESSETTSGLEYFQS